MDTQEQPFEISIKWEFSVLHVISYQIIVLTGFKNTFECIHLLYQMYNIGCKDSALSYNIIR